MSSNEQKSSPSTALTPVVKPVQAGSGAVDVYSDINTDLSKYGYGYKDIDARVFTPIDADTYGLPHTTKGYKIPYYGINGKPQPYVRIREFPNKVNANGRIITVSGSMRYVYCPPNFASANFRKYNFILLTDNELIAASMLNKYGVPAVAIPGVDGWRSDPESTDLAYGLVDVAEYAIKFDLPIVIYFSSGNNRSIQTELATLAFELKFTCNMGLNSIKQYTANTLSIAELVATSRRSGCFPKHPNIRVYIQDRLNIADKVLRRDYIEVSFCMVADLESSGTRFRSTTDGHYYYFDMISHELHHAIFTSDKETHMDPQFTKYLYTKYGVGVTDNQVIGWFKTQFMAEEGVRETSYHKIMTCNPRNECTLGIQLTASKYMYFGADQTTGKSLPAKVVFNGENNILFERKGVSPVDVPRFEAFLRRQRADARVNDGVVPMWWGDVINTLRLEASGEFKIILALLYYVSPWLKGWKGIQLPIEIVTGEAGSGKSSLFMLRKDILCGNRHLSATPPTIRDWNALIVNTTGLSVMDNVHLMNSAYLQQLSDAMCQIVTDPNASIDTRMLFTTADLGQFPVNCTFGVTSIDNVFVKPDLLQRSVLLRLDKTYSPSGAQRSAEQIYYKEWVNHQMHKFGGREAWLAHHVLVLEKFFQYASVEWNEAMESKTRLINLEQAIIVMGRVFGMDVSEWAADVLLSAGARNVLLIDSVIRGLTIFASWWYKKNKSKVFTAKNITDWAECHDEFSLNKTLCSPRAIGKYISNNKSVVLESACIRVSNMSVKGVTYNVTDDAKKLV